MFSIQFSDSAKKQFSKLERGIQQRIVSTLERIRIRPQSYLIKLVDEPGYKMRVGDYRVLIDIQNQTMTLLVIKVGHRKDIYDRKKHT